MNTITSQIPSILYVDDDKDDLFFLKESFANSVQASMISASDGEEAVQWLTNVPIQDLPALIILDLNMPKKDGRQTLEYLKSTPRFSKIPVVILSTSKNSVDKEICTNLGAVSYLEKPYHLNGYNEIVKNCISIINYNQ